jgi:hypothetical protein
MNLKWLPIRAWWVLVDQDGVVKITLMRTGEGVWISRQRTPRAFGSTIAEARINAERFLFPT